MCGIAFVYSRVINPLVLSSLARQEISSRGPTRTIENYSNLFFSHQSILAIQSNPEPKVPSLVLQDAQSHSDILYNGEIYDIDTNRFKTDTDYLKYLKYFSSYNDLSNHDGMYSVIDYHVSDSSLHLTAFRDPVGEKRLYYCHINKGRKDELFAVASTASFISRVLTSLNITLEVNHNSLRSYFSTRHHISDETCLKHISLLPAGTKLCFKSADSTLNLQKFASLNSLFSDSLYSELSSLSLQDYLARTSYELKNSLKLMQSVNHNSVNTFSVLSGGIDSSIVSAYLSKMSDTTLSHLVTLTFGDKDQVAINASNLASQLNAPYLSHNVSIEEYFYALGRVITLQSSVISTHSLPSSYILANIVRSLYNYPSVLYGGEGADELFLGYSYYLSSVISNKFVVPKYSGDLNFDTQDFSQSDVFNFYSSQGESDILAHIRCCSYSDYINQLPYVGLAASDLIASDCGIEFRSPFTRLPVIKHALNSPTRYLLNLSFTPTPKYPLSYIFNSLYGCCPEPKIGFSGFPNECLKRTPQIRDAYLSVNDWINSSNIVSLDSTQAFDWKKINTSLFLHHHQLSL